MKHINEIKIEGNRWILNSHQSKFLSDDVFNRPTRQYHKFSFGQYAPYHKVIDEYFTILLGKPFKRG